VRTLQHFYYSAEHEHHCCRNETTTQTPPAVVSNAPNNEGDVPMTLDSAVEQAKRAFALKKYEQAVDFYATALEFA
jgi:HAT1-interacting factor 1